MVADALLKIGVKCLGCNVLMGAHATHDKVFFHSWTTFSGLAPTVGIVYWYTVFSDRTKLELQSETDIWGPTNW